MSRRQETEALGTGQVGGGEPKWCLDQIGFTWLGEIRIQRGGPASPQQEQVLPAQVERLPDGTIKITTPDFIASVNPGNGCVPPPPVIKCNP